MMRRSVESNLRPKISTSPFNTADKEEYSRKTHSGTTSTLVVSEDLSVQPTKRANWTKKKLSKRPQVERKRKISRF